MNLAYDLYPRLAPKTGARLLRFSKLKEGTSFRREAWGTGSGLLVMPGDSTDADAIDPAGLDYVRVYDLDICPLRTLATSDAGDDEIDTTSAHNLVVGRIVEFTALTGGTGLSTDVAYHVVAVPSSTSFKVALTAGGTAINFTTNITAGTVRRLVPLGGFFLDQGDFEALTARGTKDLRFGGAGTLSYLARAIMLNETYVTGGSDPFDDIWRLHLQGLSLPDPHTLGAMFWRIITEAQDPDRPTDPIPDASMTFDTDVDTDAVDWPTWDGEFIASIGESVLSVTQRLMQLGLYVDMDGDFGLHAYVSYGRDLTGLAWGTGVVRFQAPTDGTIATGNITSDATRAVAGKVKRSDLLVGSQDVYELVNDPSADIVWEGAYRAEPADDPTALQTVGNVQLAARADAGDTPRLRMRTGNDAANGLYTPGPYAATGDTLWLWDTVTLHTGSATTWDWDEAAYPVAAISWNLRPGGDWDVWLDLGSTYQSFESRSFQEGGTVGAHTHPPNPRLCQGTGSTFLLTYGSTNGNHLSFGYIDPDDNTTEVELWDQVADGGPYPKTVSGPGLASEPVWYIRDYAIGCLIRSDDTFVPGSFGGFPYQPHFQKVGNQLQWNDAGTSDAGCHTVDGSFVDLVVQIQTLGEGDCAADIGDACAVGTAGRAARCDHVHAHPLLTTGSYHSAASVTYDPASSGLTATDTQAAIDEVEGRVDDLESASSPVGVTHLITAHVFPIIAHRGDINGTDGYPENTTEALLLAAKRGAHGVEFDVQQTSDGEWALLHDVGASALNRTTSLTGTVASKTLATIQAGDIDGGFGYDAGRHGTSLNVPSATQVMTALEPYDLILYWHLKDTADSAGTNLATFIVAGGWKERSIVLCDGGTSQAAAVKAVDATLETSTLNTVYDTPQSSANVDRLLAEEGVITNSAYVDARQPDPVDCYLLLEDHWGVDERTILSNMWARGVRLYLTADLPLALAYRHEIVEDVAYLDSTAKVPTALLGTGSASSSTYLRGDRTWAAAASALDDLTDVTLTSSVAGDRLRYNGSAWVNSAKRWVPMTIDPALDGSWQLLFTDGGDVYMSEVEG